MKKKKQAQKPSRKSGLKIVWSAVKSGVTKAFKILAKIFLVLWEAFQKILQFVLTLTDNLLKALASIITSVAKIIQALALSFIAIGLVGFLFVMSFYFLSKSLDLDTSAKFKALREKVIENYLDEFTEHLERENRL